MSSLLIGAGHNRRKKIYLPDASEWSDPLTTLDMGDNCGADVVWDLDTRPLPFNDEEFDEIAAYDVLEHVGRQGDWRGYFDEMAEYHRLLKPGGVFGIIVPIGADAFADPGHTRFFGANHFMFLDQGFYETALAEGKQIADYRFYWKLQFDILHLEHQGGHHILCLLRKPA